MKVQCCVKLYKLGALFLRVQFFMFFKPQVHKWVLHSSEGFMLEPSAFLFDPYQLFI